MGSDAVNTEGKNGETAKRGRELRLRMLAGQVWLFVWASESDYAGPCVACNLLIRIIPLFHYCSISGLVPIA